MVRSAIIAVALLSSAVAWAAEPVGCDKFRWSLDQERALLAKPAAVRSGDTLAGPLGHAVNVALVPFAEAKLPMAPQRAPKDAHGTAGFVHAGAPPKAGLYRITLADAAWIDVVQDGREVASVAFSGAVGCSGVRKSVKFQLEPEPFTIQLSGTTAHSLALVVTPD